MEFKSIVKKIMESAELKSKLRKMKTFEEIYNFFKGNGYEGSEQELKEKLLPKSTALGELTDEDLINIAGGISGRQVLATCAAVMVLTGGLPATNISTGANAILPVPPGVTAIKRKPSIADSHKISKLSRKKILRLVELLALCSFYSVCVLDSTDNYTGVFFQTELKKCYAEMLEILSEKDYTEYKSKLDELLSSTDFENFDDSKFNKKSEDLSNKYGLSDDIIDQLEDYSLIDSIDNAYKSLRFQWIAKKQLLRSLKKSLNNYDKPLSKIFSEKEIEEFKEYFITVTEKHVDLLNE